MKRLLHALAALWPERRGGGSPPLPDTRTGIFQHGAAVLRMERILGEFADTPIRKFAKETAGAGAPGELVRSDRKNELSKRQQSKFANPQIRESATKPLLTIVILVFFMCLMAAKQVSAQAEPAAAAAIKPLQIGDTIHEELWHLPLQVVNHPNGKETITLNDYRGKLIILDFWATWCGSCVAAMPGIFSIQQEFDDQFKLLLVSSEAAEKIQQFLQTNTRVSNLALASVAADSWMHRLFEHRTVPHYVWIDARGIVLATTISSEVTFQNVSAVLSGEGADLDQKINIDYDKPYFFRGGINGSAYYSILIAGKQPGIGVGKNRKRYQDGAIYSRLFINTDLRHLYSNLAMDLFREKDLEFSPKSLVFELKDPSVINGDLRSENKVDRQNWLYSYEIIVPNNNSGNLVYFMWDDLNRYLPFVAKIEQRYTTCLVLQRADAAYVARASNETVLDELSVKGVGLLRNKPIGTLIQALENFVDTPWPIVDGTGIDYPIELSLDLTKSLPDLQADLERYGLTLQEKQWQRDLFVIKDK